MASSGRQSNLMPWAGSDIKDAYDFDIEDFEDSLGAFAAPAVDAKQRTPKKQSTKQVKRHTEMRQRSSSVMDKADSYLRKYPDRSSVRRSRADEFEDVDDYIDSDEDAVHIKSHGSGVGLTRTTSSHNWGLNKHDFTADAEDSDITAGPRATEEDESIESDAHDEHDAHDAALFATRAGSENGSSAATPQSPDPPLALYAAEEPQSETRHRRKRSGHVQVSRDGLHHVLMGDSFTYPENTSLSRHKREIASDIPNVSDLSFEDEASIQESNFAALKETDDASFDNAKGAVGSSQKRSHARLGRSGVDVRRLNPEVASIPSRDSLAGDGENVRNLKVEDINDSATSSNARAIKGVGDREKGENLWKRKESLALSVASEKSDRYNSDFEVDDSMPSTPASGHKREDLQPHLQMASTALLTFDLAEHAFEGNARHGADPYEPEDMNMQYVDVQAELNALRASRTEAIVNKESYELPCSDANESSVEGVDVMAELEALRAGKGGGGSKEVVLESSRGENVYKNPEGVDVLTELQALRNASRSGKTEFREPMKDDDPVAGSQAEAVQREPGNVKRVLVPNQDDLELTDSALPRDQINADTSDASDFSLVDAELADEVRGLRELELQVASRRQESQRLRRRLAEERKIRKRSAELQKELKRLREEDEKLLESFKKEMYLLGDEGFDSNADKGSTAKVSIEREPPCAPQSVTRMAKNALGQLVEVRDMGTQMVGNHAGVQAALGPGRDMRGTESSLDQPNATMGRRTRFLGHRVIPQLAPPSGYAKMDLKDSSYAWRGPFACVGSNGEEPSKYAGRTLPGYQRNAPQDGTTEGTAIEKLAESLNQHLSLIYRRQEEVNRMHAATFLSVPNVWFGMKGAKDENAQQPEVEILHSSGAPPNMGTSKAEVNEAGEVEEYLDDFSEEDDGEQGSGTRAPSDAGSGVKKPSSAEHVQESASKAYGKGGFKHYSFGDPAKGAGLNTTTFRSQDPVPSAMALSVTQSAFRQQLLAIRTSLAALRKQATSVGLRNDFHAYATYS